MLAGNRAIRHRFSMEQETDGGPCRHARRKISLDRRNGWARRERPRLPAPEIEACADRDSPTAETPRNREDRVHRLPRVRRPGVSDSHCGLARRDDAADEDAGLRRESLQGLRAICSAAPPARAWPESPRDSV